MASLPSPSVPSHSPFFKFKSRRGREKKSTSHGFPMRRPFQPRVFARLQTLLPPFAQSSTRSTSSSNTPTGLVLSPPPQFLKVRIITWNMHDSVPKGNLEELLGAVPLHIPRDMVNDADRLGIPNLSLEKGHPYHIIVVAGQECPTLSGIPLGLAANFKHRNAKDKEKEDKHREKDLEKDVEKDHVQDKDHVHHTRHLFSNHKHDDVSHTKNTDTLNTEVRHDKSSHHNFTHTPGWSAVLEDWLANGVGSVHDTTPIVAGTPQSPAEIMGSSSPSSQMQPDNSDPSSQLHDISVTDSDPSSTPNKKGSYELLVKERLMGIYSAVYVHKDLRSLIRGVSTGVVPAGLMGGRLGNKGGVGISINVDGSTMLFINAHLAAHEGKAPLRVANLVKIKSELPLESWLAADDQRMVAEDITDRFDYSWIFGDLNFRLELSRHEAEQFISRKEYSEALAHDQLHQLMESDEGAFSGFNEAQISFPPTFKYDVMHTLKHDKEKLHFGHRNTKVEEDDWVYVEVEEGEGESLNIQPLATSPQSGHAVEAKGNGNSSSSGSSGRVLGLMGRTVVRAKRKMRRTIASREKLPVSSIDVSHDPKVKSEALSPVQIPRRAASLNGQLGGEDREDTQEVQENDQGVYDSSSKQRVPSWCDRILWKTTVEPPKEQMDPEPILNDEPESTSSPGVEQRFLRGLLSRPGQGSVDSNPTSDSDARPAKRFPFVLSPFSKSSQPEVSSSTSPSLHKCKSLDTPTAPVGALQHPNDLDLNKTTSPTANKTNAFRRQSVPVYSHPAPLPRTPRRAKSDQTSSRVPAWFLNLISRDRSPPATTSDTQTQPPDHRKGDIICLSYHTLDDKQMRRLEGRSDHRPVMGSFAVHI